MDPYLEQLGNILRVERKKKKLNQTDAGKSACVSRQDISEIENGQFKGSILKVQDYAMSLGYSLSLEIKRRPQLSELEELFNED
ncbi:MAG: helix-turn-helix transcriptional regulator [Thiohalomonadales bacterium]